MNAMLVQFLVSDVITSLDGGDCKTLVVARFLFCGEDKCHLFIELKTKGVKGSCDVVFRLSCFSVFRTSD